MLNISLCDDDKVSRTYFKKQVKKYSILNSCEILITEFNSGLQLIDSYDPNFDIIFLDIMMQPISGISTALEIRKKDINIPIVFTTFSKDFAIESYKVNALNYVLKPFNYGTIQLILNKTVEQKLYSKNYIINKNYDEYSKIYINDILYIETYNRNLLIKTLSSSYINHSKLRIFEQELHNYGFVRCHHSFLVNINFIKTINKLDICMIDDKIIPISNPKKSRVLKEISAFWINRQDKNFVKSFD